MISIVSKYATLVTMILYGGALSFGQSSYLDSLEQYIKVIRNVEDFDRLDAFVEEVKPIQGASTSSIPARYLSYIQQAHDWALENKDKPRIEVAKHLFFNYYYFTPDNTKKIYWAEQVFNNGKIYDERRAAGLLTVLRALYLQNGDVKKFVDSHQNVESLNEIYPDLQLYNSYSFHHKLGTFYYEEALYRQALTHFFEELEFQRQQQSQQHLRIANTQNNIALCYKTLMKKDSSILYFDKSIETLKNRPSGAEDGFNHEYAQHFLNVVQAYKAEFLIPEGRYNEILPFYIKELISAKQHNDNHLVGKGYLRLSQICFLKEDTDLAKTYLDSTFQELERFLIIPVKKEALALQIKLQLFQGKLDHANQSAIAYDRFIDSLELAKSTQQYLRYTTQFETIQKEAALAASVKEVALRKTRSLYLGIGLIVASLLTSMLLILYFRSRKNKKIIDDQKAQLQRSLVEKEVLLKETHHRVKNNLQVISGFLQLFSRRVKGEEVKQLVKNSQSHIDAMALVHQMLYQQDDVSSVPVEPYFEHLSNQILQLFRRDDVIVTIMGEDQTLSLDRTIPLGIIINELMTNSLKHAFPKGDGQITISLTRNTKNDHFIFTYTDNGIGISNLDKTNMKQLGMRLIGMLAEEMHGKDQFTGEEGVTYTLEFLEK